ncbi:MAG TPA: hemerythrin domain-containing protein [Thermoanaerobaculia bacterium]|nr:hemerythrin domain-containing protein [Thermoanaerobaculia bacterium]
MRLLDELRREHDLIDRLLGSLLTVPHGADALEIVEIFEAYAAGWHHEREETVLFAALAEILPADRGPIAVLLADHRAMAESLAVMRATAHTGAFAQHARAYARALWPHIDAENSVLFPESEMQLRRNGIRELSAGDTPAAVREMEAHAEALIARYPPRGDADVVRGEGCVVCPSYGDACAGIEREWWNEWEWEELSERVAST